LTAILDTGWCELRGPAGGVGFGWGVVAEAGLVALTVVEVRSATVDDAQIRDTRGAWLDVRGKCRSSLAGAAAE